MKPLIALVVDHPLRDLPSTTLLAYELAKSGADVCLVPLNLLMAETFAIAPDLLILNNIRRTTEGVLSGCIEHNISYGMLDTEGGLYGDLAPFEVSFSERQDIRDNLACSFIWGKKVYDFIIKRKIFRENQLLLTGSPRFDFYHPKWADFYKATQSNNEKIVLIPTKVSAANPIGRTLEQETKFLIDEIGYDEETVHRWRDVGIKQVKETISMMKNLSKDFPDVKFVVRPHPHENLDTYADALSDYSNIEVIRKGTIDQWIARSILLIHRKCTTAVEAMMAGVPSVAPLWVPTSANAPDAEKVSKLCENYESLKESITDCLNGKDILSEENYEAQKTIIDDWFFKIDGISYKRISDRLIDIVKNKDLSLKKDTKKLFFRFANKPTSIRGFLGRVAFLCAHIIPLKLWGNLVHPHNKKWENTVKSFSKEEVQEIVSAIAEAEDKGKGNIIVESPSESTNYPRYYQGKSIFIRNK
ncbi:hypothetical protein IMCC1989_1772 [gamma proteobacterium IMCC1989]|nr:hypothetical protein IMCC1989_1772 [gamma proteobacterium IMCC1989]